jgi:hypothetical protein
MLAIRYRKVRKGIGRTASLERKDSIQSLVTIMFLLSSPLNIHIFS